MDVNRMIKAAGSIIQSAVKGNIRVKSSQNHLFLGTPVTKCDTHESTHTYHIHGSIHVSIK